ncbi:hypothetical protein [Actinomadura hibisca]|nr:hypothetical protein [Actinomadura hibisca]
MISTLARGTGNVGQLAIAAADAHHNPANAPVETRDPTLTAAVPAMA